MNTAWIAERVAGTDKKKIGCRSCVDDIIRRLSVSLFQYKAEALEVIEMLE